MERRHNAAGRVGTVRIGTVSNFDAARGLGFVEDGTGRSHMFHCTVIADGSRSIEVGARVEFELRPGGPGRWEAFAVSAAPSEPENS